MVELLAGAGISLLSVLIGAAVAGTNKKERP